MIGAPIFAAALSFAPNSKHKPGKCLRFEKERQGGGEQMVILSKGAGAKRALLRRGGTPGETRTHYIPLRRRTLYPGEVRGLGERGVRELDLKYCSGCGCSCQASGKKTGRNPL